MNNSRRDFLKKAALLSGSTALTNMLPPVIQKALAINPEKGSSFYDAEHIVFLMQENRSFDHLFGTLRGVRGFNDPRAIQLPNKNKVWLQSNPQGETYVPFRLNTRETKVPWMGSTPHGWSDQTDARNKGKYNRWLEVKRPYNKAYAEVPLTLGYCDRADFPFYYSLADAFTICDQHFCSSITGTHPNRYYWMTGTVRERNTVDAKAHLWNISNYNKPELDWKTYPERLEQAGVSWRIYQNELTMGFGLKGEESAWLSNFGTNVMEYFKAYNVRLHPSSIANLVTKKANILQEIAQLKAGQKTEENEQRLAAAQKVLAMIESDQLLYTKDAYEELTAAQKKLNEKAFTVNSGDSDFHSLATLKYSDSGTEREFNIPQGDVLHQFRNDVKNGTLPTVSWLMSAANFSDHPGAPWFGSWYVNEVMEILLENPDVWKKTIFVLTYDENDGFFDHVPPYAAPNPYEEHSGKVSAGIDPRMDFVTKDQQTNPSAMENRIRESSVGLGYRVPLIIASPWTRGGFVNSELFDHTSSLQFLEHFMEKKFNKKVREENITAWRRAICGDLTSVFRTYNGETIERPQFLEKQAFLEDIHKSQFKEIPNNYRALSQEEIEQVNNDHRSAAFFPQQEKGIKNACSTPYELYTNGVYDRENQRYTIQFQSGNKIFGNRSKGSPFLVYAMEQYLSDPLRTWEYAVAPGDTLNDHWDIAHFEQDQYHLRVYAPNGFYREFVGDKQHPGIRVNCGYEGGGDQNGPLTGNLEVTVHNDADTERSIVLTDNSYKGNTIQQTIAPASSTTILLDLSESYQWYDFSIRLSDASVWHERYAGHVETGEISKTDPLMGAVL